jgi:MoaA/NifB/PqqE/SkfB family radical SAM enzyme
MPAGGPSCECGIREPSIHLNDVASFSRAIKLQRRWREFVENGEIDSLVSELDDAFKLREVTAFINNSCNLRCKHCFIAYSSTKSLPENEWDTILNQVFESKPEQFGIVGTEPLLTPKLLQKCLNACEKNRKKNPDFKFGFITNLTKLTEEIAENIGDIDPSFINISIDGTRKYHDMIRGDGSFDLTVRNLESLKKYYRDDTKVFILSTLSRLVIDHYVSFLNEANQDLGIRRFVISPFVGYQDNREELSIDIERFLRIIEIIAETINKKNIESVDVFLKLDYFTFPGILGLIKEGWLKEDELVTDSSERLFFINPLGKNSRLVFIYYPLPENFWKSVRIGPQGRISGCSEMFAPDYEKRSISLFEFESLEKACKSALNGWMGKSFYSVYINKARHLLKYLDYKDRVDNIIIAEPYS